MSIFRKPGERPYYPPEPAKPAKPKPPTPEEVLRKLRNQTKHQTGDLAYLATLMRPKSQYWRPKFHRPSVFSLWFGFIVLLIVGAIAYNIYNPCVRYGPEKKYWTTQSCGENCFYTTEETYRQCLEREKK